MYNDARGSGPFTTSPYLQLQWRLIALDWLYQRHLCFLPGIHWKDSASSTHAVPFSQSAVIKFVFLAHFFHHSFFSIDWKSNFWSLEDVLLHRAQQKVQKEVNNGKQDRQRDWGFSEVCVFFFFFTFVPVWNEIQNGQFFDTAGTLVEGSRCQDGKAPKR